ncbi:MAG: D-aminoacylase [Pseudomonadota bacterium]|nr:D-aminoacylase [Pseudomonadota bacterium]MED5556341.1 D-aminoacylase [Pseudomonadota bacterium]
MSADLLIRNATVYDGLGGEPFEANVAVEGTRITAVGEAVPAYREIDAGGIALAPGFIDTHSHDDGAFLRHPDMAFKLAQGVTTVVAGNCGFSAIPAEPSTDPNVASGGILAGLSDADFTDLEGYFDAVIARKPAINNMMLVGHNTIRSITMGLEPKAPTTHQLGLMRGHVERAMEQGACGFSTGLIYRPGRYSNTDEVIELTRSVTDYDGLYATHMRNEGEGLLEAIEETLTIGREADVHAHISHHKAAGRPNWGKVGASLARVETAIRSGQRVTLDVYPYTAGSGRMIEYFNLDNPSRELAEVIRIASCPAFREFEGRMLTDIASERNIDITEAVLLILKAPKGDQTICIQFIIDEADIETNLAYHDMMIGSDGIPALRGKPHPRLFGTFPRILRKYVRERGILSLSEAIRRMTSLSASTFGMDGRGRIAEGCFADLVLFDADTVHDTATYDDPKREPEGISLVVVNGAVALERGQHTGVGSGKMLRFHAAAHDD